MKNGCLSFQKDEILRESKVLPGLFLLSQTSTHTNDDFKTKTNFEFFRILLVAEPLILNANIFQTIHRMVPQDNL